MAKTTTVTFKRDFSPRKKGETAELETKLADYYLSIGVAELPCTGCKDDHSERCEDCKKAKGEPVAKGSIPETGLEKKKDTNEKKNKNK